MIRIIADTTSCLPENVQSEFNIDLVPQLIHFGEKSFTEGVDINTDSFLSLLEESTQLPKTSAPPPELYKPILDSCSTDDTIICIHPSTDLSGTVRSAQTAGLDYPDLDIRVIDTRLVASPLGSVVHQAATWASAGMPADDICKSVLELSQRARIYFLVSTLEYLARGGRIGSASALLGNALQIKPILNLVDGQVDTLAKERTFNKALQHIKNLAINEYPENKEGYMSIMHAGSADLANELSDFFVNKLDIPRPLISFLPPAIITHAGPGSIAVGFFS